MVDFVLFVIQFAVLSLILGAFGVLILVMLYLASEEVRNLVSDFERWAERRRLKKHFQRTSAHPRHANIIVNHGRMSPADAARLKQKWIENHGSMYPEQPKKTVFEQVAADHPEVDTREILRRRKEQEAKDQETLDRATEYRNDISD